MTGVGPAPLELTPGATAVLVPVVLGEAPAVTVPTDAGLREAAAHLPADVALAQWVPSGPDFHEDILHALLVSAAFHAEQRLLLATPYFVPDEGLQEALVLAAKAGATFISPFVGRHDDNGFDGMQLIADIRATGAIVRLISDGDVAGAIAAARPRPLSPPVMSARLPASLPDPR